MKRIEFFEDKNDFLDALNEGMSSYTPILNNVSQCTGGGVFYKAVFIWNSGSKLNSIVYVQIKRDINLIKDFIQTIDST